MFWKCISNGKSMLFGEDSLSLWCFPLLKMQIFVLRCCTDKWQRQNSPAASTTDKPWPWDQQRRWHAVTVLSPRWADVCVNLSCLDSWRDLPEESIWSTDSRISGKSRKSSMGEPTTVPCVSGDCCQPQMMTVSSEHQRLAVPPLCFQTASVSSFFSLLVC